MPKRFSNEEIDRLSVAVAPEEGDGGPRRFSNTDIDRLSSDFAAVPDLSPARQYAEQIREAGPRTPELLRSIAEAEGPWMREEILRELPGVMQRGGPNAARGIFGQMGEAALEGAAAVPRGLETSLGMAGMAISGAERLDPLSEQQQAFMAQALQQKQQGDPLIKSSDPWYRAWPIKVAQMAPQMGAGVGIGVASGALPMVAFWMSQTLPDRYNELKSEGLPENTARGAALVSSVVESAIETVQINPLQGATKTAVRESIRPVVVRLLKNYGKELSEETLQALTQDTVGALARQYEGQATPEFWSVVQHTTNATLDAAGPLALMIGGGGMAGVALRELADRSPAAARRLAAIREPSRKQVADAGLDPALFPSKESRAQASAELAEIVKTEPERIQEAVAREPETIEPDLPAVRPESAELPPTQETARAVQIEAPAKVDVRQQAEDGPRVGREDAQGQTIARPVEEAVAPAPPSAPPAAAGAVNEIPAVLLQKQISPAEATDLAHRRYMRHQQSVADRTNEWAKKVEAETGQKSGPAYEPKLPESLGINSAIRYVRDAWPNVAEQFRTEKALRSAIERIRPSGQGEFTVPYQAKAKTPEGIGHRPIRYDKWSRQDIDAWAADAFTKTLMLLDARTHLLSESDILAGQIIRRLKNGVSFRDEQDVLYFAHYKDYPGLEAKVAAAKAAAPPAPAAERAAAAVSPAPDLQPPAAAKPAAGQGMPTEPTAPEPPPPPSTPAAGGGDTSNRPPGATSARKVWMAEDRELLGLDEIESSGYRSWQEALDTASQRGIPEQAMQIAAEITQAPRALDDIETAGLVVHAARLKRLHTEATRRVERAADEADIKIASAEANRIEQDFDVLSRALRASGTEKGRALAAQKLTIDQDFKLISVLNRAKVAKGASLTPAERIWFEGEIKRLEGDIAKLNERVQRAETYKPPPDPEWLTKLSERATQAKQRLIAKLSGGTLRAGLDPEILTDLAIVGAEKIARGAKTAVDFARAMASDFGDAWERVRGNLTEIYAVAKEQYGRETVAQPEQRQQVQQQVRQLRQRQRQTAQEAVANAVGRGTPLADMGRQVNMLAEELVRQGITEREPLIDAVHEILRQHFPELTRDQTMDAISGYGDFTPLNKDPIKVRLRELKGEMQQKGKLRDMAAGVAPAKTGQERRAPSDEERRLIKEVNEAKKRGGYVVTDPERQLKTSLQAIKTRLRNQIADYEKQIRDRQKIVKTRTPTPRDAEIEALERRRDELRTQFNEIFGRKELTDEQRTALAIRATQKAIADYERRIAEKDLAPRQTQKTPETPELKALRAQRASLAEHLAKMREAAGILDERRLGRMMTQTQEEIDRLEGHLRAGTMPGPKPPGRRVTSDALEAMRARRDELRRELAQSPPAVRARLERQIADLDRRLAGPIQPPTPRQQKVETKEIERLRYEVDKRRREINRRIRELKPKTIWEHIAEPFNTARALITSIDFSAVFRQGGFIVLGHPVRSARSIGPMIQAFASPQTAHRVMTEIENRPNAPLYQKAGLHLSPVDGGPLTQQEEVFMSRWAERIPLVAASARAYTVFLNKLRADSFDTMAAGLGRNGEVAFDEARAIANFINVATGRGGLGKWEPASVMLNTIFFAPKYAVSRFQLLLVQPLYHGTVATRIAVAKEYGRFLIGLGTVLGLGMAAGGVVSGDPEDPDFGKIRFGNTRIDPLSGLAQTTRFVTAVGTGLVKTLAGGRNKKSSPLQNEATTIGRFLRTKFSPVITTAFDAVTGETIDQEKATPTTLAKNLIVPLSLRDVLTTMTEQGVPRGAAISLLGLFGMGVMTYEKRRRRRRLGSLPRLPSLSQ